LRPQIRKIGKWAIVFLIASVGMYFLVTLVLSLDPDKEKIEHFLSSSAEVRNQIGNIKSIDLTRRTSVQADDQQPEYRLYRFFVKGQMANAQIVVRSEHMPGQSEMRLEIISIERILTIQPL
jgi:uncharacterized protein YpmS